LIESLNARIKTRLSFLSFVFYFVLLLSSCTSGSSSFPFLAKIRSEELRLLKEQYLQRLANEKKTQSLREEIVAELEASGQSDPKPLLIFTAGPMGAGKSFLLDELAAGGYYQKEKFARVDPDQIKPKIPEYQIFLLMSPEEAATVVHQESGQIADELLEKELQSSRNVIVDGSLRNADWYQGQFRRIRKQYPQYSILILYVKANEATIRERIVKRAQDPKDGRHTPESLALQSIEEVEGSIHLLRDLADLTLTVDNDQQPILESIYRKGNTMNLGMEIPLSANSPDSTPPLRSLIQGFFIDPEASLDQTVKLIKTQAHP
jgi:hypothetical protein